MVIGSLILLVLFCIFAWYSKEHTILDVIILGILFLIISGFVSCIDRSIQTYDEEIWSGYAYDVKHIEEWDQWIPPQRICTRSGKTTKCTTRPGYWVHHSAENYIYTTDGGKIKVNWSLDGKVKLNDRFPNKKEELIKLWPLGTTTASKHEYKNLLKASSSLYKFDGNVKDYKLPEYPNEFKSYVKINRLIGDFENHVELNNKIMKINTNLNIRDKKQVNFILVKFDNVTNDHLYALRDYWKNGKKNDYIIALNMNGDYVQDMLIISWTEAEILNTKITTMTLHKRLDMKILINTWKMWNI